MKLLLLLSTLSVLKCITNCTQNLYIFTPEHCEVTNINESLVQMEVAKCYKLSRTELFLNISGHPKVNILNNQMGQIMITWYQFRSNEYRKGPIEFMLGMCAGFTSKDFDIPHMFANSNLRCPIIKGHHYYAYKVSPNATNMPPLIPAGRWMLQLDVMYMNKYTMFSVKWCSGVEYPIPVW